MLFFGLERPRPAVFFKEDAYAVLRPGARWKRVDRLDVVKTGAVMTEAAWRDRFSPLRPHSTAII